MGLGIYSRRSKIAVRTRQCMPGLLDVIEDRDRLWPPCHLRGQESDRNNRSQHGENQRGPSASRVSYPVELHGSADSRRHERGIRDIQTRQLPAGGGRKPRKEENAVSERVHARDDGGAISSG